MKKILLIALILLTLGAIIVVGAVVYELTITGNVIIIETPSGNYEVKAYQDAACTIPLTNVDWGTMGCGESKNFDFYLKNTGDLKINNVFVKTRGVNEGSGTNMGYFSLDVGEVHEVRAVFYVDASAAPGSYPVTIEVECTA